MVVMLIVFVIIMILFSFIAISMNRMRQCPSDHGPILSRLWVDHGSIVSRS